MIKKKIRRDKKSGFKRKRKPDPIFKDSVSEVNYKNAEFLSKFLTEKGKIIPRRITGCSAKSQRRISKVIRRARHAGVVPFVGD